MTVYVRSYNKRLQLYLLCWRRWSQALTACPPPVGGLHQDELVAGKYMRAPPEATLEAKGASKGRRAQKRGKGKPAEGVPREYCSPSGFTVRTDALLGGPLAR